VYDGCSSTYLFRSIDNYIYMKIPKGFKMPKVYNSNPKKVYPIVAMVLIWIKVIKKHMV